MISLIVCSRNIDITDSLKKNVSETIGVIFEWIIIDNSKNNYSIFSAYTEGVRLASYPYLCFMHDDLLYHTTNWGEKIINYLSDKRIGIIGVIGCHYLPAKISGWWYFSNSLSGQVLQRFYTSETNYELKHLQDKKLKLDNSDIVNAVAVDGFWFCSRKELFDIISFDNEYFKGGWHGYDLDICLQADNSGYSNAVIFDVLIEHFSNGNHNNEWVRAMELFNKKWSEVLPYKKGGNCETDEDVFNQLKWEICKAFSDRNIQLFNETYLILNKWYPGYLTIKSKLKRTIIKHKTLWFIFFLLKKVRQLHHE